MAAFFNQAFLFGLLGGLGLFLFGMKVMSEGLQKVSGDRIRRILAALTTNRFVGALVGLAVTALVQSSSATAVMVVGFVNAGLMSLMQAIGVVLGANIGTTLTAQIIAFKISHFALPAIGIGVGLRLFSRRPSVSYAGEVLLGAGLVFFGFEIMRDAFDPIRNSEGLQRFFLHFGDSRILGVLAGALITVVVQSSSATIGLTLALATSGLLSFEASVALVLGENIGTAITTNLAAIGTNLAARRTALAHLLFNAAGVGLALIFFHPFLQLIISLTPGAADFVVMTQAQGEALGASVGHKPFIARHIANAHTLFNLTTVLLFLPFLGVLAKATSILLRGRDEEMEFHLRYLDSRVLNTPPIALGQARAETKRMAQIALEALNETVSFLHDLDERRIGGLVKKEEILDRLQKEIMNFLVALSQKSITQEISREIVAMMYMVNDLERIGDHCEHLWELGVRKKTERVTFSEMAAAEMEDLAQKTKIFLDYVIHALDRRDAALQENALSMENEIDRLERELRDNHMTRLNTGECNVKQGLIFIDMVHNFEKVGDHTFNLTKVICENR